MNWFEVITDFCVGLMPKIQETALLIMEWLTKEIEIVGISTGFYPYEILFGATLLGLLTYGFVAWVLDIWPS